MNPLETLKQKLKVKPNIEERKPVAIVIKGKERVEKPKIMPSTLIKQNLKTNMKESELEEGELEEGELEEGELEEEQLKPEKKIQKATFIIDETHKGFNRTDLLKKLMDKGLKKVVDKPTIEMTQAQTQIQEQIPVTIQQIEAAPPHPIKKARKPKKKLKLIIEEDEPEQVAEQILENVVRAETNPLTIATILPNPPTEKAPALEEEGEVEVIPIPAPKKPTRKTKKVEKGVAILGPETIVTIGDTDLRKRLPIPKPPINIKVSSYYMNNREKFVNFINSVFEPYRLELQENKESISCKDIGKTTNDFSLLTHQKIVRDYLNLYTPYRGLLLYHGLGSGKTCTSIAIAEGMKTSKQIIIMLPASLRANYVKQLKECGDLLYKKIQYWEWISTQTYPEAATPISAILNLPLEYINRQKGAWFVNIKKKSNYNSLSDTERKSLDMQLNEMINQKYKFINYNGLRAQRLSEMTAGFTKNLFDDSVIIIDEAHNFISRIVNKIKKEKPIPENKKGEKEQLPTNLSLKLYEFLLSAKNARVILLSGTPVINYPNEFAILFNILRGYIKTWKIPLNIQTSKKIDKNSLYDMLIGEKTLDYLDYSPASKILTITRNPFGFKNKIKVESGYQGVSNVKKNEKGENMMDTEYISDDDFERKIISILKRNDIIVISEGIEIQNKKALPDKLDLFEAQYIDSITKNIKNADALKRRILGLSSYFKSAQENLLPKYDKILGVDYHVVKIPMSNFQLKIYESARKEERKMEKRKKKPTLADDYEQTSTYRIFSRLYCNFVMTDRPIPFLAKKKKQEEEKENENSELGNLLKEAQREEMRQDFDANQEGEIEGDEILDKIGGVDYKEKLEEAFNYIKEHPTEYLTPEALETYSPKYLNILENIKDPEYIGLHLVYSQFRTMEGIGVFTLVLNNNGFTRFKIKKNSLDVWELDIQEDDKGKPTYALYTGTETTEEKEIIRLIYNGEWDQIPENIARELKKIANNNNTGEIIKVLMITSSGSEGINLRNTRYVHIMEPYWHPVRLEQVIGRARRICSHEGLPKKLQTVEVFVYLMIFSPEQLKSDDAIELKRHDLSKSIPHVPLTSDQFLYEISEIKANLTSQLTNIIKESAFDCYIYSNGKCVNFSNPSDNKFSYVPDYSQQENDTTAQSNKIAIEWVGNPITIGDVEYVSRRVSDKMLYIYDKNSYLQAMTNPEIIPLQIGTLEINEKGQKVFKTIV